MKIADQHIGTAIFQQQRHVMHRSGADSHMNCADTSANLIEDFRDQGMRQSPPRRNIQRLFARQGPCTQARPSFIQPAKNLLCRLQEQLAFLGQRRRISSPIDERNTDPGLE